MLRNSSSWKWRREKYGFEETLWYMGVSSLILTKFSEKPIILFDEFRWVNAQVNDAQSLTKINVTTMENAPHRYG
jgi:hypothetical protein